MFFLHPEVSWHCGQTGLTKASAT